MRRTLCLLALGAACSAGAQDARTVDIGRVQEVDIVLPGELRHAAPKDDGAPVLLRLVKAEKDGAGFCYRVAFSVLEAGEFDLGQLLLDAAQAPPAAGLGGAPAKVRAVSHLPADFNGQPLPPPDSGLGFVAWYRPVAWCAALLWLAGLGVIVGKLYVRGRAAPVAKAPPAVSPWQILLGSLEACRADEDWRRLEMRFLSLAAAEHPQASLGELFGRLRADSQAGPILAALEAALHRPGAGADRGRLGSELAALCRHKLAEEAAS